MALKIMNNYNSHVSFGSFDYEQINHFLETFVIEIREDLESNRYPYSLTSHVNASDINNQNRIFDVKMTGNALRFLAKMCEDVELERKMILNNPTVQDAYEKFLMTLALCKNPV